MTERFIAIIIMVSVGVLSTVALCFLLIQGTAPVEGRNDPVRNSSQSLKALCPNLRNENDVSPYRYNSQDRKCYLIGTQGPCGNNMRFISKDEVYGHCDCNSPSDRILIYHAQTKQCYFIFQQGYCKSRRQWLDINREGKPICTANPCSSKTTQNQEYVLFKNQCVALHNKHPDCGQGESIAFQANSRLPKCIAPVFGIKSIGVPPTPCDAGSVGAIGGICQPPFDFEDD